MKATKKRIIVEIDAPAEWACNLINGDRENYSDEDLKEIDSWLLCLPEYVTECVGIKGDSDDFYDTSFIGRFEFPSQGLLQCDLSTYIFFAQGDAS